MTSSGVTYSSNNSNSEVGSGVDSPGTCVVISLVAIALLGGLSPLPPPQADIRIAAEITADRARMRILRVPS